MGENDNFDKIWESLRDKKKILMTLHNGPDGDSLGSCTAMKYVLEREFGSDITLISRDELSETLSKFPYAKEVVFGKKITEIDLGSFDAVLFLDCGALDYATSLKEEDLKRCFSVNIDHHHTNSYFGSLNYIDSDASSTCSVLARKFDELGLEFDKEMATRLLLGVCTDSDFFRFRNARSALGDASFLVSKGADYYEGVVVPILYNRPLNLEKYFSLLMNNLKVDKRGFCFSSVSHDDITRLGLNRSEVRLGVSTLDGIADMDFVFTLSELEGEIKGSFRSNKGVDVSRYAKELGGGGHKSAAAFILPLMPLGEAEKKVLEVIDKVGFARL